MNIRSSANWNIQMLNKNKITFKMLLRNTIVLVSQVFWKHYNVDTVVIRFDVAYLSNDIENDLMFIKYIENYILSDMFIFADDTTLATIIQ